MTQVFGLTLVQSPKPNYLPTIKQLNENKITVTFFQKLKNF